MAFLTWSVVAGGGKAGEWEIMRREASSCWGGKKKLGTTIGSGLHGIVKGQKYLKAYPHARPTPQLTSIKPFMFSSSYSSCP